MHTSQTSESNPNVETSEAPSSLNLLGDPNAGGCCGGSACAVPGE
ncbi:MAG: hypothetical protein ACTH8F_13825 [Microbacterium sp.]